MGALAFWSTLAKAWRPLASFVKVSGPPQIFVWVSQIEIGADNRRLEILTQCQKPLADAALMIGASQRD